jgi:hypothetical protein
VKAIAVLPFVFAATLVPAFAQQTPQMTVPLANKHLTGVVESIDHVDGETRVVLRDSDGFDDDVTIASDAQMRPEGAELAVGDRVRLTGYNGGNYFDATAVAIVGGDAAPAPEAPVAQQPAPPPPQNTLPSYAVPAPAYPAYAYVPYPVYVPAPVYYGYPPAVSIGFGFGFYGGYRGPHYAVRGGYVPAPRYARPYGYRR